MQMNCCQRTRVVCCIVCNGCAIFLVFFKNLYFNSLSVSGYCRKIYRSTKQSEDSTRSANWMYYEIPISCILWIKDAWIAKREESIQSKRLSRFGHRTGHYLHPWLPLKISWLTKWNCLPWLTLIIFSAHSSTRQSNWLLNLFAPDTYQIFLKQLS